MILKGRFLPESVVKNDFLMAGNPKNKFWIALREKIKDMYQWNPWKKGNFVYAGCRIRQSTSYSIHVSQEDFCNSLSPIAIQSDGSCSDKNPMTPSETSQVRALLMKTQWRSLQSAPQYAARIGIASSTLSNGKLAKLRETNSIIRDMHKIAKEDLIFHNFNFGRINRLKYTDLVFLH